MSDWRNYERHPLSEEYEDLKGRTFQRMVDNLKAYGIQNGRKVMLHESKIVDGWQLYRACLIADLQPQFQSVVLPKDQTIEEWVEIVNDLRRHETQEKAERRADERRERVIEARTNGQSLREIAEEEGVSTATVQRDLQSVTPVTPEGESTQSNGQTEDEESAENESGAQARPEDDLTERAKKEKELWDRIRVYLEANPKSSNKGAAKELDCSEHTVKKVKIALEEEWEARQTIFCRDCRVNGKKSKCPKCKEARELADHKEDEPEEPKGETIEDRIKAHNLLHEQWCRSLAKLSEEMPDGPWIQDLNRREGAQRKLKDAAEAVRSAKCTKACPQCGGTGCKICKKTGMMTSYALKQL